MRTITNQTEVFSFLENFGQTSFDPKKNCVRLFEAGKHLALLLFCHDGIAKGATLFILSSPPAPNEIEGELLSELMTIEGDIICDEVREKAMDVLRELSLRKDSGRHFFEAH